MTTRRTLTAAAGIALTLTLAACAPASPTSDPTPSFTSDEEAFAAAEETYRAYVDALNEVDLSDPETFEGVWAWSAGDLNAADRKSLTEYHADGLRITGESVVESVAGVNSEGGDQIQLAVCLNVTTFDLQSASGDSLVPVDRDDIQSLSVGLARSASSPTGLLVDAIAPREGVPTCE